MRLSRQYHNNGSINNDFLSQNLGSGSEFIPLNTQYGINYNKSIYAQGNNFTGLNTQKLNPLEMTYMHLHKQSIYSDRNNMQQTATSYKFGADPLKQTNNSVFKQTLNSYLPSIGRGHDTDENQKSMQTTYDMTFNVGGSNLYTS